MTPASLCEHIQALGPIRHPQQQECVECVRIGATWVHLRTCQECGRTHCCDSSPNRHATRHVWESGHPVVASAEPGERWLFCYPDQLWVEY
jgi:hypothetical protein